MLEVYLLPILWWGESIHLNTYTMRLINATTFKIHEFLSDDSIPPFAILSHTWGNDEVTLQQMDDPNVSMREGYAKIKLCCAQAVQDKLQWAWVDT